MQNSTRLSGDEAKSLKHAMLDASVKNVDVARLAGVSPAAVSHVLAGRDPLSERIRSAIYLLVPEWAEQNLLNKYSP